MPIISEYFPTRTGGLSIPTFTGKVHNITHAQNVPLTGKESQIVNLSIQRKGKKTNTDFCILVFLKGYVHLYNQIFFILLIHVLI